MKTDNEVKLLDELLQLTKACDITWDFVTKADSSANRSYVTQLESHRLSLERWQGRRGESYWVNVARQDECLLTVRSENDPEKRTRLEALWSFVDGRYEQQKTARADGALESVLDELRIRKKKMT